MLLTKEVEVKIGTKNIKYYRELGYIFNKIGDIIIVKIEHLTPGNHAGVDVKCDYCGKIIHMAYYTYANKIKNNPKIACKECVKYKLKEIMQEKYGVDYASQLKEFKEKYKQTCLEKYGVDNPAKLQEIQEKMRATNLQRYGDEYPQRNPEIKEKSILNRDTLNSKEETAIKRIATMRNKYGVDYASQIPEAKAKFKDTCLSRYGVKNISQHPEIQNRVRESLYKNRTTPTSVQQLYLHNLYGGELNYPISYYSADICLLDSMIDVEYDGGGHGLQVKFGNLTQEEFHKKEIIRHYRIKQAGYKIMRIISSKDKLPSDEILLQMLKKAKDYFNTTEHTWVEYNIDTSTMRNAEHKDGVFFDYGKLRSVKKELSA